MTRRFSRALSALAGSLALLTVTATAHAAVITFDGAPAPATLGDAQAVTTQYSAQGVTFSGTGAVLNATSDFMVTGYSGNNFLGYNSQAFIDFNGSASVSQAFDVLTFASPLTSVSFLAGSGLSPASGRTLSVRAFDASNMLVDSSAVTLGSMLQSVGVSGMGITRVEFDVDLEFVDEEGVAFVIDDVTTDTVPEPLTVGLLAVGLTGMAIRRRRAAQL